MNKYEILGMQYITAFKQGIISKKVKDKFIKEIDEAIKQEELALGNYERLQGIINDYTRLDNPNNEIIEF